MVSFKEDARSNDSNFAQKQLEKHGWTKGKGLGKDESGMANAIKVGIKKDTLGVGYDVGKEYTNNWWDQMFNNTANNIVIEHSESGDVQVSKKQDSCKKPKKYLRVKGEALLYGRFVKASQNSEENTSELPKEKIDIKYTDEELLKACGGRTGHKSARHGHQLSGKLRRIAEQEKLTDAKHCGVNEEPTNIVDVKPRKNEKKRKEKSKKKELDDTNMDLNENNLILCEEEKTSEKQRKVEKKKKRKEKITKKESKNIDEEINNTLLLNNNDLICAKEDAKEDKKDRKKKMKRKRKLRDSSPTEDCLQKSKQSRNESEDDEIPGNKRRKNNKKC